MPFISLITEPQEILRIPKFPSELKAVDLKDDDGFTTYTFTLEVDKDAASKKGITTLYLELMPQIPNPPKPTQQSPSQSAISYIGTTTATAMTAIKYAAELRKSVLASKRIWIGGPKSITKFIQKPSIMSAVDKAPTFHLDDTSKIMGPTSKIVRSKMPFQSLGKIIPPIKPEDKPVELLESKTRGPQVDAYNPKVPQSIGVGSPGLLQDKRRVFKSVLQEGKDPASITSMTPITSVLKGSTLAGPVSKILYSPPLVAPLPQMFFFQPRFTEVTCTLRVPKGQLDDLSTFYVRAALYSKKVRSTDFKIFSVPHSKFMNTYLTPTSKPQFGASYIKPGKVSIEIKQSDPKADRVKVFRRLSPATDATNSKGTGWLEIFDQPISEYERVVFTDNVMYSGQIIYRALSYGSNGKPSEEFTSKVLKPITKAPITTALTANAKFTEQSKDSKVVIRVTDIPPGEDVTAVRLQRYDITYDSKRLRQQNKGKGFVYVGNPQNVLVVGDTQTEFIDDTVERGRSYQYMPIGISSTVGTIYGVPYTLEIPPASGDPSVAMEIAAPRLTSNLPGITDLEMNLAGQFTEFGFNKVRETLSSEGQEQLYNDQIDKNREQFGKLISFKVVRENLTNGDSEDFGLVEAGKFKDDASTRSSRGISEPQRGVEYAYSVTAVINTPDYLFPRIMKEEVDKETLNIVKKSVSLLSSPVTKQGGVLPSTAKQFDINAKDKVFPTDPRMAGITNIQQKFSFVFPDPTNSIENVVIEEFKDFNRISWTFDGDLSKLDHFRISLKAGGGSVIIDTVHCDPGINKFYYRHNDIGFAVDYQYEITPVDLLYNDVQPTTTNLISATMEGALPKMKTFDQSAFGSSGVKKDTFSFPVDIGAVKL